MKNMFGGWDPFSVENLIEFYKERLKELTLEKNTGAGELYDLQEDPHEITNLFDQSKTIRKELEDMIRSRPEDELSKPLIPSGLH